MADFSKQISNFEKNGVFIYQFDEVGNVILNLSSSAFQQNYLSIPLSNVNYNYNKIASFYDDTFTEFITSQTPEQEQIIVNQYTNEIDVLNAKNEELKMQLNRLISENELNSSAANEQVIKDIILGLRILLNQGTSSEDFESEFPYLPIPLEKKDSAP